LRRAGVRPGSDPGAQDFRILFRSQLNLREALARVGSRSDDIAQLVAFIRASKRGVAMGPRGGVLDVDDAADD
jgi:hypothetical protein